MAIGKAKKVPMYVEDYSTPEGYKLVPNDRICVSMCCDHRVIEGAYATKFGQKFKLFIENPNLMLMNLS